MVYGTYYESANEQLSAQKHKNSPGPNPKKISNPKISSPNQTLPLRCNSSSFDAPFLSI